MTAAIAIRVGGYIAHLQNAGDEFDDVLFQLRGTSSVLEKLKDLFAAENAANAANVPASILDEYLRDLRLRQNELDDIDKLLQAISRKLYDRETSLFSRIRQKNSLANGEMSRLTNRLLFFNQSLMNMLATHQNRMLLEIHKGVTSVRKTGQELKRGMRMDIGVRYGSAALNAIQGDEWGVEPATTTTRRTRSLPAYGTPLPTAPLGVPEIPGDTGICCGRSPMLQYSPPPPTYHSAPLECGDDMFYEPRMPSPPPVHSPVSPTSSTTTWASSLPSTAPYPVERSSYFHTPMPSAPYSSSPPPPRSSSNSSYSTEYSGRAYGGVPLYEHSGQYYGGGLHPPAPHHDLRRSSSNRMLNAGSAYGGQPTLHRAASTRILQTHYAQELRRSQMDEWG